MRPTELEEALTSAPPACLYVISASDAEAFDTHLAERCVERIVATALPDVERETGLSIFHGDECDLGALLAACQTMPMFGGRSVVLCRHADKLGADAQETLSEALPGLPESTTVLLVAAKLDGRLKFTKRLKKIAEWVDVTTPTDPAALADWVRQRVAEFDKTIDPQLAREFATRVGRVDRLAEQVEQVVLYSGDEREITRAAVEALWRLEPEDNVFAITDALARRDAAGALRAFTDADRSGAHYLQLLALIEGAIRRLAGIRQGMDAGLGNDAIAERLGIKAGAVYYQRENAARWTLDSLRDLHRRVLEVEYQTKTGSGDPRLRLEQFLVEACG